MKSVKENLRRMLVKFKGQPNTTVNVVIEREGVEKPLSRFEKRE